MGIKSSFKITFGKIKPLLYSGTLKDTTLLVSGGAISTALGFLLTVILARSLNPIEFGILITSLTFVQTISDIFEAGTNASVFNFVSSSIDEERLSFIKATFLSKLFISIIVSGLVFVLYGQLTNEIFRNRSIEPFIKVAPIGVFLTILITWGQTVLQAEKRFFDYTLNNLSINFLKIVAILALLVVGSFNFFTAYLAVLIVPVITLSLLFAKIDKGFLTAILKKGTIERVWKFSLPVGIGFACWAIYTRLDQILVFNIGGAKEAGIYGLAFKVSSIIILVAAAFGNAVTPRFASLRGEAFITYFKKAIVACGLLAALSAVSIPISPILLPIIFGDKFISSVLPFQLLAAGSILFLLSFPFSYGILYRFKKPSYTLWSSTFYLVLLWVLLNHYIPIYGSTGAALSVMIMYLMQLIISVSYFFYSLKSASLKKA